VLEGRYFTPGQENHILLFLRAQKPQPHFPAKNSIFPINQGNRGFRGASVAGKIGDMLLDSFPGVLRKTFCPSVTGNDSI